MQHQKDKGQYDGSVLRSACRKLNREAHGAGLDPLNYLSTWQILWHVC